MKHIMNKCQGVRKTNKTIIPLLYCYNMPILYLFSSVPTQNVGPSWCPRCRSEAHKKHYYSKTPRQIRLSDGPWVHIILLLYTIVIDGTRCVTEYTWCATVDRLLNRVVFRVFYRHDKTAETGRRERHRLLFRHVRRNDDWHKRARILGIWYVTRLTPARYTILARRARTGRDATRHDGTSSAVPSVDGDREDRPKYSTPPIISAACPVSTRFNSENNTRNLIFSRHITCLFLD